MDVDFKNRMMKLSRKMNIDLNDQQIDMFYKYMNLLLEWNEKINLTAITDVDEIVLKHFIDSMTILKYIKGNEKIVYVGTGAGFPGIPIAIVRPEVQVTLLDSLNKRIIFLDEVIEKLALKNAKTVHGRAETFGQDEAYREKFDISTSRAVAKLSTLSEYLIPLVRVGGHCICMKGSDVEEELKEAEFAIKELGGEIKENQKFNLPGSDISRNIIIIEKQKETKSRYPRKAGTPSKEPLKEK